MEFADAINLGLRRLIASW